MLDEMHAARLSKPIGGWRGSATAGAAASDTAAAMSLIGTASAVGESSATSLYLTRTASATMNRWCPRVPRGEIPRRPTVPAADRGVQVRLSAPLTCGPSESRFEPLCRLQS